MNKLKQLIKNYVDKLIIKHSKFLEEWYNFIGATSVLLFIVTLFVGCFIHAPKIMFTILDLELLLMISLMQFEKYINSVLDKD